MTGQLMLQQLPKLTAGGGGRSVNLLQSNSQQTDQLNRIQK